MSIRFDTLFYEQPYLAKFTAKVVACVGPLGNKGQNYYNVQLSETAFYPEGGGQPGDRGSLNGIAVYNTVYVDEAICCQAAAAFTVGQEVRAEIDRERRFAFMQQHSGEHLISGLAKRHFGAQNVGFHINETEMTLDLDLELSETELDFLESEANACVWRNQPIEISYPTAAERAQLDYRSKKELEGAVRLIQIAGVDSCACCGTHLSRTGEIGLIKIVRAEKYKAGLRLTVLCGGRALRHYALLQKEAQQLGQLFSAQPLQLLAAAEKALLQNTELKEELLRKNRLVWDYALDKLPQGDKALLSLRALSKDELKEAAKYALRRFPSLVVIFSNTDEEQVLRFVMCSELADITPLYKGLSSTFAVKGGGSLGFFQGQIKGKFETIRQFLYEAAGLE